MRQTMEKRKDFITLGLPRRLVEDETISGRFEKGETEYSQRKTGRGLEGHNDKLGRGMETTEHMKKVGVEEGHGTTGRATLQRGTRYKEIRRRGAKEKTVVNRFDGMKGFFASRGISIGHHGGNLLIWYVYFRTGGLGYKSVRFASRRRRSSGRASNSRGLSARNQQEAGISEKNTSGFDGSDRG